MFIGHSSDTRITLLHGRGHARSDAARRAPVTSATRHSVGSVTQSALELEAPAQLHIGAAERSGTKLCWVSSCCDWRFQPTTVCSLPRCVTSRDIWHVEGLW